MKAQIDDRVKLFDGRTARIVGTPYHDKYYARLEPRGQFIVLAPDKIERKLDSQLELKLCIT